MLSVTGHYDALGQKLNTQSSAWNNNLLKEHSLLSKLSVMLVKTRDSIIHADRKDVKSLVLQLADNSGHLYTRGAEMFY